MVRAPKLFAAVADRPCIASMIARATNPEPCLQASASALFPPRRGRERILAARCDRTSPARARESVKTSERAVEFLAAAAGRGPILELGVGTGRLALPLVQRGFVVHGIDASPAMVARLRAKPGGDRVTITMGDFADLAVAGRFSLIFVAFNTFFGLLTQEAQIRCFAGIA